jgi:predicted dehydrogenase
MSPSPSRKLRVAMVGCGAVAHAHVPTVQACAGSDVSLYVDSSLERARATAAKYGGGEALASWAEIPGRAEAAIVALPHHLHATASIELLRRGVHVLVEKPMALSTRECDAMIAAAREGKAVLAVGLVSRWFGVARMVKTLLDGGVLGRVRRFDVREGHVYSWPVASDFMFRRETGGGVLADTGPHVLDLLLWWLGDAVRVEYRDDDRGGVEADCELDLELANGARGTVELSRTRELRNTWLLEGERGTLEVERRFASILELRLTGEPVELEGRLVQDGKPEDPLGCFHRQWRDFVEAVADQRPSATPGEEGRRAVALIEQARTSRRPLAFAWEAWTGTSRGRS